MVINLDVATTKPLLMQFVTHKYSKASLIRFADLVFGKKI